MDASNKVYLSSQDESVNHNESYNLRSNKTLPNEDSEEDDALLTQVLNEHQEKMNSSSVKEDRTNKSPPAKKSRPILNTLFEENVDENQQRSNPISLASFLNSQNSPSSQENKPNNHHTSYYIIETDEEE